MDRRQFLQGALGGTISLVVGSSVQAGGQILSNDAKVAIISELIKTASGRQRLAHLMVQPIYKRRANVFVPA